MGEITKIEWADHTLNFWIGCEKVSAACDFCYAEAWANRFMADKGLWNGNRHRTSKSTWQQPFKWNAQAKKDRVRRRVFVNSLSDFFDNQIDPDWRREAFNIMAQCLWLDFMLLTKRPQNIPKLAPQMATKDGRPWAPNVWLGTTVENQEEADRRIDHLLQVPASKHFLSCEPLLNRVWLHNRWFDQHHMVGTINLVIVGGESGLGARPMHPDWARGVRDQCAAAGVPFFLKQWGEWAPGEGTGAKENALVTFVPVDGSWSTPERRDARGHVMHRAGKASAGRLLDGIEHNGMPA